MTTTFVYVLHRSRELCVQKRSSVILTLALILELATRMALDITVPADWDTLEVTVKVTCVIQALVCMADTVEYIMVILSVTALHSIKEIDVKSLIRVILALA